ncbi:MAG: WG repeat-containing protein [Solobacterium sp.]|nr:WG repeat-containing protein [Solobacterium sp.]
MSQIYARGKELFDISPALVTEKAMVGIAREEIQKLISVPTGVDTTVLMQDMTEEEQKTTILLYQQNRNTEEIAEELNISRERAEAIIASAKNKIEEKLSNKEFGDGITAIGLLIGMLKAWPVSVMPAAVPASVVTPGIAGSAPKIIAAGGNKAVSSGAVSASSAAVSTSAPQAAAVSGGKAVESSVVYTASNAGPVSTAAGSSAAAAKTVTAGTAVKTAAAAGGATAAKVAATAAVAVTVVGGGGYAGYKYYESKTNEPEPAPEAVTDPEMEEEIRTPVPTEVVVEETEEPASGVVWIKEPQFEFDTVEPLTGYCYSSCRYSFVGMYDEVKGYPQEWMANETLTSGERIPAYTSNAAEFADGDNGGVISYDGEILVDGLKNNGYMYSSLSRAEVVEWAAYTGYINYSPAEDTYEESMVVLDSDFIGPADRSYAGGVGMDIEYSVVYHRGQLYYYSEFYGDSFAENKTPFGDYEDEDLGSLVKVFDDNWNELGYGYITKEHAPVMVPEGEIISPYIVNGFYAVTESRTGNAYYAKNYDTCAWVKAETGERITDFIYEDTWFFEDGYCPVKKDGYWGFINEEGKEVTDFIFEDVSTLYDGRVFVKVNGKYGILDLKTTLENGIPVTSETVGSNSEETDTDGSGENDPYTGEYYEPLAGRIRLSIEKKDGIYYVSSTGSGGASIYYAYEFSGVFDDNGRMDYTNCVMTSTEYTENGETTENTEYTGGIGYLIINGGKATWHVNPETSDGYDIELIRYTEE